MKTLLLLRHGKSDWDADYRHDHDRPLAKRGRKAAKKIGKWLKGHGPLPDRIVTSSAERARRTVERAHKKGNWTAPILVTRTLYDADPEDVLGVVRAQPDSSRVLMLVGHEPTWSMALDDFTEGFDEHFPTAALACIDFDVEAWQDVAFGEGRLAWIVRPREL